MRKTSAKTTAEALKLYRIAISKPFKNGIFKGGKKPCHPIIDHYLYVLCILSIVVDEVNWRFSVVFSVFIQGLCGNFDHSGLSIAVSVTLVTIDK